MAFFFLNQVQICYVKLINIPELNVKEEKNTIPVRKGIWRSKTEFNSQVHNVGQQQKKPFTSKYKTMRILEIALSRKKNPNWTPGPQNKPEAAERHRMTNEGPTGAEPPH